MGDTWDVRYWYEVRPAGDGVGVFQTSLGSSMLVCVAYNGMALRIAEALNAAEGLTPTTIEAEYQRFLDTEEQEP